MTPGADAAAPVQAVRPALRSAADPLPPPAMSDPATPDPAAPQPRPRRPPLTDRLGVRLGLVLGLALLPVGLMSMVQSADLLDTARARSEALAGQTLRAVRPKLSLVNRAQGVAEALAAMPASGAECRPTLLRMLDTHDFAFVGQYDTDGRARCAAGPAPPDFTGSRALAMILTDHRPALSVVRLPPLGPVLVALHPRLDAGGAVTGFAAVSPQTPVHAPLADIRAAPEGFALILFDRMGEVLSSSVQIEQTRAFLPAGRPLSNLMIEDTATFTAASEGTGDRVYSLVRLVEGELFALGTWPEKRPGLAALRAIPPLILPALMWAISLIAAWFAAEKLVSRHIRRLRSAIIAFAGGNRTVRPLDLTGAPREIRETADAFERMTSTILRDEAELEDALHGKEVLLREVHHRVKNNLQLIASIVNMQLRRTKSDEARSVMRSLQERMLSLATIHNGLYQTADLSEIEADQLFPGIIDHVVRGAHRGNRTVRVTSQIEALKLPLDQAVPLALLLTEALSNAMRYANTADGSAPLLSVTFRMDGSRDALLEVTNSAAVPPAVAADPGEGSSASGIGTQLLRGFTRQLGGQFHREFTAGLCQVKVWFSPGARAVAA